MIRNLKALGLALVAVFAIGAVSASAASAADVITTDGTTWVTGVSHTDEFKITAEPGHAEQSFNCTTSKFLATSNNLASEITVEPTYSGKLNETPHGEDCTSSSGFGFKVDMNGCDYDLTGNTSAEDPVGTKRGTVSITCPVGQEIKVTDTSGCTISVHGQTATSGGVIYTNTPANKVTLDILVTGVTYSSNAICQLGGFTAEGNNADYTDTVVAEGFAHGGGSLSGHTPVEGAATAISFS